MQQYPAKSTNETASAYADGPERADHPVASLRRNFCWTLCGNVVYSVCLWGMLVALARFGTPEIVGRFALGYAVTAPVVMFANLQLRAVLATDARGEHRFGDYLALRLATTTLALLVTAAIVFAVGYAPGTAAVVLMVGLMKAVESLSDVYHGLLQKHERMDRIAKSLLARGPLSLAALSLAFYFSRSLTIACACVAAVSAMVLFAYDSRAPVVVGAHAGSQADAPFRPRWDRRVLARIVVLCLPLGLVMMLVSLNANIPRYFIQHQMGEHSLGIFAAITYLMVAGITVVSALGQSSIPRLARHFGTGDVGAFRGLLVKLIGIGLFMGAAGIVLAVFAGRWLLNLLYGAEYQAHAGVLVWVSVAAALAFVQWFLDSGMTASRRFRIQVPLYSLVTAVNAVCCLLLVPVHGLTGAAMAMVIGALVLAVGAAAVNLRVMARMRDGIPGC